MSAILTNHIELVAPFLSCRDLCKLAQTCKEVKNAAETVEEGVFSKNPLVHVMNRAVKAGASMLCVHVTSEGIRSERSIPLSFGESSRAKLRAVEQHRECWKSHDACVRVLLKPQFHHTPGITVPMLITEELLFVTAKYSDNVVKRMVWTVVGAY